MRSSWAVTVLPLSAALCASVSPVGASPRPAPTTAAPIGSVGVQPASDAACDTAVVACASADGVSARAARLAGLEASIEQAAHAAAVEVHAGKLSAEELAQRARVREIGHRVESFHAPLQVVFEEVREAAARIVERHALAEDRDPREQLAWLSDVLLRWVDTDALLLDPDAPLSAGIVVGCNESLLNDEGWIARDWRQLVICPGFLLLEAERVDGSSEQTADSAAFLIAHELGHVVERTANDPRSESDADLWGYEILAEYVTARASRGDDARALTSRALGSFCDLDEDGLHELGRERAQRAAARVGEILCR